ncbi:MAG: hypothetical protein Q9223_002239 [Gallowayella weberi]
MCFFKIDTKHQPLKPPGAAPTLVSLEDHYKATLAGNLEEPKTELEKGNPTSRAIASSLDVNEKLEPKRSAKLSSVAAGKRKMNVPDGKKGPETRAS